MSPSYHLASFSCHSRYSLRDIFCVVLLSLRRSACCFYVAHHVTHCLVSMLCHFAILRVSRVSLYVAFAASPVTSVWFPVSLRPFVVRFSSVVSFPEGALFVPFLCRLYACRFSTPFLSYSHHRHTLYEENVLCNLKMKTYRHETRAKKFHL